jgi:uncharacterized protein (TIGR02118 family)
MPDPEFFDWWRDVHGMQEWRPQEGIRRYVQHHTLAEARDLPLKPTHDGASIGWFDDFEQMRATFAKLKDVKWGPSRFDPKMDVAIATEHVVVDGATRPDMVKGIFVASRHPNLSVDEFQRHWREVHGELWAKVPGVRRYVQNHAIPEAYTRAYNPDRKDRTVTHDGWSELWFDDLSALERALATAEREDARQDAAGLFATPLAVVIGRETPIKT